MWVDFFESLVQLEQQTHRIRHFERTHALYEILDGLHLRADDGTLGGIGQLAFHKKCRPPRRHDDGNFFQIALVGFKNMFSDFSEESFHFFKEGTKGQSGAPRGAQRHKVLCSRLVG